MSTKVQKQTKPPVASAKKQKEAPKPMSKEELLKLTEKEKRARPEFIENPITKKPVLRASDNGKKIEKAVADGNIDSLKKKPIADIETIRILQAARPDLMTNSFIGRTFAAAEEKGQIKVRKFPTEWGGKGAKEGPKRMSARNLFMHENYHRIKQEHPTIPGKAGKGEMTLLKKISEYYNALSDDERADYQRRADEENEKNGIASSRKEKKPTQVKPSELYNKKMGGVRSANLNAWKTLSPELKKPFIEEAKQINADLPERKAAYEEKYPATKKKGIAKVMETVADSIVSLMVGVGLKQSMEDADDGTEDPEADKEEDDVMEEEYEDAEEMDEENAI